MIQIGSKQYILNPKKFPYLDAYLSFLRHSGQLADQIPTHADIPFFDVIVYCLKHGHRHFFRRMPPDISSYRTVCDSIELLGIDVLKGRNIRDFMDELRWCGRSPCNPDDRSVIPVNKRLARDVAFRLVYQYLLGDFATGELGPADRDANMAFNVAIFVVSHPLVFRWRTRKMVRAAFEDRFNISRKQRAALDRHPIEDPSSDVAQEEDVTTDEEDGNGMDGLTHPV
jgi:hypothetical protein